MKNGFILGPALVLGGGILGCSTNHRSVISEQSQQNLYLHFFYPTFYSATNPRPPKLIISTRIHLCQDIDVTLSENEGIKGRIESRDGRFFAHLQGHTFSDTGFFDGEVTLDKPFEPQRGGFSSMIVRVIFVLSSNPNYKPFLEQQAANDKLLFEEASKYKQK